MKAQGKSTNLEKAATEPSTKQSWITYACALAVQTVMHIDI